MKIFSTSLLLFLLATSGIRSQVVINEFSCSNTSTIADNFGSYEDWIELYNTTGSAVSLNGWYMSDKKSNPTKWQISNASIPANGFLLVWASGRDISTGTLHAGFKLTQCKPEAIVLANAAGVIVDSLTLNPTQEGHSRGRTTNGAASWSLFLVPTPNAGNSNPYSNYQTRPLMSVPPGFYSSAQSVTITSPGAGVTIRYTTDGSTPTPASTLYSAPVSISSTTVLRARAFNSNASIPPSFVESNTYFINSPHTVEVVSVYGDQLMSLMNGNITDPYTGLEYFDKNGVFKSESYGTTNKHGNDSWAYDQRGIDFVTRDQYGYNYAIIDQVFNSKSRTEFQRLIFKAAANDNYPFENGAHIRDAYVQTLSQKARLHMDERTWAPCVLYVNGQYWGVYDTREKVDDADFMEYYHNTKEDSLQMLKTWGGTWSEYGGAQAQTDWSNLAAYILGNNMAVAANYNYVDNLYSTKSLADYVILNSFVVCSDWLNWNTIWWRGLNTNASKKKWRYCLWDEDATFGHYINYTGIPNTGTNADPCDPESLGDPGGEGHVPILNALLQNPTFNQYYIMRYFDLLNGPMTCTRMVDILDSMVNVIQPEMQGQVNKWGGSYNTWWANYQSLRTFITDRCNQVVQQFDDCYPVTGPFPIKVNVTPPGAGTIDLNSLTLSSFVWSGQYPGNLDILMTAHANPTYCFDHWEFQNHTPLPGISDTAINFKLSMTDSIVAHFSTNTSVPTVTATPPTICTGDTSQLQVNTGSSFVWSPAAGLSCTTCSNPIATPSATTTYTVTTSGGCASGTANVTVTVAQPGISHPSVTASWQTLCIGDTTQLQVTNSDTYLWSPSAGLSCSDCANPIAVPAATTTYTVSVTGGCSAGTGSITISIVQPPVISLSANQSICKESSVKLFATGGTSYNWSPSYGLSCVNCPGPVASPDTTTTYTVIASNGPGVACRDTAALTVFITGDCPDIYIPNGFSPNGDGNNDVYYIFGLLKELNLVIYDRWGQVVFETSDQSIGWDGTKDGIELQSGVYGYKIEITDLNGVKSTQAGNITLMR